jgi:hypothetical protein
MEISLVILLGLYLGIAVLAAMTLFIWGMFQGNLSFLRIALWGLAWPILLFRVLSN